MTSDGDGRIIRSTGGFYYVDTGSEIVECRARGLFRKEGRKPVVGDYVCMERTEDGGGYRRTSAP